MSGKKSRIESMPLSNSRIETFECPRRFSKLFIEKFYEPDSVMSIAGRIGHSVAAQYLTWLYTEQKMTFPKILSASLDRVFYEYDKFKKWPAHFSEEQKDSVKVTAQNLVEILIAAGWSIDPGVRYWRVEEQISFDKQWNRLPPEAWFDNSITNFRAILDWQYIPLDTPSLVIVDHKTGWGEPNPDQLPLYALCGFKALNPQERMLVNRVDVKWNLLVRRAEIVDGGYYTPEEIGEIQKRIEAKMIEIRTNTDWSPKAGPSCQYCGFVGDCPAVDKAWFEVVENIQDNKPAPHWSIPDMPAAEDLLELYILVGARLSELEGLLKDFVKKSGPIHRAGKVMESRSSEVWTMTDPYGMQTAFREIGIHPVDIIPATGFSKGDLWDVLKKYGRQRHYKEFADRFGSLTNKTKDPSVYVDKEAKKK